MIQFLGVSVAPSKSITLWSSRSGAKLVLKRASLRMNKKEAQATRHLFSFCRKTKTDLKAFIVLLLARAPRHAAWIITAAATSWCLRVILIFSLSRSC